MDPRKRREFGDFQTPPALGAEIVKWLSRRGVTPRSLFEPTCGTGGLLHAAISGFSTLERSLGIDVAPDHVALARHPRAEVRVGNVFEEDLALLLRPLPDPLLVFGNPPWVTTSAVGALRGHNTPPRTRGTHRRGLDAITGASNFDVSEWIVLRLLAAMIDRPNATSTLSMLVKTGTARRVLAHAWRAGWPLHRTTLVHIDAARWFGAAASACLLTCDVGEREQQPTCAVYEDFTAKRVQARFGFREGMLVADLAAHARARPMISAEHEGARRPPNGDTARWRSGVKHDCARVMEVSPHVRDTLEPMHVYPMLKSSELPHRRVSRFMIVPQRRVGDDTSVLASSAPRTFAYLEQHREALARRASSIYRGRAPFSVFGVGEYTFAPWKVAISGLYKKLDFHVIGPHEGRPVVLDDTAYFLPCSTGREARALAALLNGPLARDFFRAFVFWDAKRPITAALLCRLDLRAVAAATPKDAARGDRR